MARIASTTSAGVPVSDPTGGMTIDALMARQKMLAEQAGQIAAPRQMISPWQGAAQLGQSFVNNLKEGQTEDRLKAGRASLAQIMSGIDPTSGATSEQTGQAYQIDPDLGLKLMEQAIEARRAAAAQQLHASERTEDRQWNVSDADRAAQAANASREDQQAAARDLQTGSQTFAQQQAEAARAAAAAVPKSSEGQIMADFKNGAYGDPTTPEAAALRDRAMQKATAIPTPAGVNADRKALWDQQDQFIGSTQTVSQLQRASDLLKEGINTGYTAGLSTYAGNAGVGGEEWKAYADRTKEYNSIMNKEAITAMAQQLKGATTDTEMAKFIENMNDPTLDPAVKQRQIDTMIARAQAHNELQTTRIKELGGEAPQVPSATAVDPAAEAQTIQDARDAISKGAPADLVRKRLADKGIDPSKL